MKRQIRKNAFETNSSSIHSLTVSKEGLTETLQVDKKTNKVITHFGEFGWGYDCFTDSETKLSYLVTMLVVTHSDCNSIEELCETNDFKKINNAVAKYCNCDGILINEKITEEYGWTKHRGYIDHQSIQGINSLLQEYDCTIEEFLFDKGVILIIDNDNH